MEVFKTIVQTGIFFLFIILTLLMFLAFSNTVKLNKRVKRLKKRYDIILRGQGELNLEEVLVEHAKDIDSIKKDLIKSSMKQEKASIELSKSIQRVGFYKYDAFSYLQNKLSYTLVLLDSDNNGVMLTNIYGRESSNSFAKKVENGKVLGNTSNDEKIALNKAITT